MCILSYLPAGVELSDQGIEDLWTGGIKNDDGHGWAIAADGVIVMGKSLQLDEALAAFQEAREKYPKGPALFHSRWATHGSVNTNNCHPFVVGGDPRTVLAHNGILSGATPQKGDDRSDTRILADDILPKRWFRLDKPTVRQNMTQWCGTFNKVVILTVNPRYRQNAYIINESQGYWDKVTGIWHSNQDYLGLPRWRQPKDQSFRRYATYWMDPEDYYAEYHEQRWGKTIGYRKAADDIVKEAEKVLDESQQVLDEAQQETKELLMLSAAKDVCDLCCVAGVNKDNVCTACGTCQDCFEHQRDCQCHIPRGVYTGR